MFYFSKIWLMCVGCVDDDAKPWAGSVHMVVGFSLLTKNNHTTLELNPVDSLVNPLIIWNGPV